MASLSSSTSSLHKDVRSESRSYKRDKDHKVKWALGSRPLHGVKRCMWTSEPVTGTPEQLAQSRPEKRWSDNYNSGNINHAARRVDARNEISTSQSLSKSLTELPLIYSSDARSPDADIMYSFDAPTAPREVVKLDGLVDKAEQEWKSRETDKIVKNEYAVLDERGEVQVPAKGRGKKNSPRQRALSVSSTPQDEDDWERI